MTHLRGNVLVFKDHPRIAFRGYIDLLEAEITLAQQAAAQEGYRTLCGELEEVLGFRPALHPAFRCALRAGGGGASVLPGAGGAAGAVPLPGKILRPAPLPGALDRREPPSWR